MSAVEDRLRGDLPLLADLLVGTAAEVPQPNPHYQAEPDEPTRVVEPAEPTPRGRTRRRRGWIVAAAASAVAVVGIGATVALMVDRSEDGSVRTVADGDATTPREPNAADPAALGTWLAMPDAPISPRPHAVTAWTGTEAVFWAGSNLDRSFAYTDGAAYDPTTDTWRELAVPGWGHPGLVSAFDGREIYVLAKNGGARVDTSSDTWTDLPQVSGMFLTGVVATDDAVWALGPSDVAADQPDLAIARYDPDDDRWVYGPSLDGSQPGGSRFAGLDLVDQPALWTGHEIVVWDPEGGGAAFDPSTETWSQVPAPVPPDGRILTTTAVMTDVGLVAVAEVEDGEVSIAFATLSGDTWEWMDIRVPVAGLRDATVAAAGDWVAIFAPGEPPVTVHVPTSAWAVQADAPLIGANAPNVVWTGTQLVVWGGSSGVADDPERAAGAVWTPPSATGSDPAGQRDAG